jgi:hypothetical protein
MGRFRKAAEGAGLSIESDKTTIAPRKVLIEHAARRPRFSRSIAVGMAVLVVTVSWHSSDSSGTMVACPSALEQNIARGNAFSTHQSLNPKFFRSSYNQQTSD